METIILKWLKLGFLYCKILSIDVLTKSLNDFGQNICNFVVSKSSNGYLVKIFNENDLIKEFEFIIKNDIIIDIK